jgi:hypothetical protein
MNKCYLELRTGHLCRRRARKVWAGAVHQRERCDDYSPASAAHAPASVMAVWTAHQCRHCCASSPWPRHPPGRAVLRPASAVAHRHHGRGRSHMKRAKGAASSPWPRQRSPPGRAVLRPASAVAHRHHGRGRSHMRSELKGLTIAREAYIKVYNPTMLPGIHTYIHTQQCYRVANAARPVERYVDRYLVTMATSSPWLRTTSREACTWKRAKGADYRPLSVHTGLQSCNATGHTYIRTLQCYWAYLHTYIHTQLVFLDDLTRSVLIVPT